MGPHSPDPEEWGPSYTSSKSSNPNNGGPLCQKSFEKSPAPQGSACWGSHWQPPSLQVILPMDESTLSIAIMTRLEISEKGPGYVEKVPKQEPWDLSSGTLHWKPPPRNTAFSRALVAQAALAGHRGVLPPCGHFLELQAPELCFWAPQNHEACKGHQPISNVHWQVIKKEFKRGQIMRKPISRGQFKLDALFFFPLLFFFFLKAHILNMLHNFHYPELQITAAR